MSHTNYVHIVDFIKAQMFKKKIEIEQIKLWTTWDDCYTDHKLFVMVKKKS